jgi:hypothetical protein
VHDSCGAWLPPNAASLNCGIRQFRPNCLFRTPREVTVGADQIH